MLAMALGVARRTIINLKNDRDRGALTDDEEKELDNAVSRVMFEIKEGINILTSSTDVMDIFEHFKVINSEIKKEHKREIVELVCKKGNVQLLEMICRQENKDGGGKAKLDKQYSWKGEFTGYERLTDLLQYVLEQPCSPEIVLCIAKKVYGSAHVIYNGEQYLDDIQVANIKRNFDYPNSVIKDCLKAAIELGYKDVVPVMLGGDIYHCIRLMKGEKFQEGKKALDMVGETVVEVMSSWVEYEKQSFKGDVQRLLAQGIEVDINKMGKQELIDELEDRGIKLSKKGKDSKKRLVEKLRGEEVRIRLGKTVVGALISTLFFNYQNELMKDKKPFELGISSADKNRREKEINELNENIDSKKFVQERVLQSIQLLNSSSHIRNHWFFREVLAKIVNDEEKLGKLQAVCTAICKEPMQRSLKGVEVHIDVLKFFGVKISSSQITTSEVPTNLTSLDSERNSIGEKCAEILAIELNLQEASTSQQQSAKAANNQQKESGSDTQFGQQQQPNAQATANDQPSSELSEVQQISRSQSLSSSHSNNSDIEVISRP